MFIIVLFCVVVVCKEWLVREDSALAQHLQSKESKIAVNIFCFLLLFIMIFFQSANITAVIDIATNWCAKTSQRHLANR